MKSMNELAYHYGIKIRIYPSSQVIKQIRLNSDVSRWFYNRQIGLDKYGWDIKRLYGLKYYYDPLIKHWYKSIQAKREAKYTKKMFIWLNDKKIDSLAFANAKQNHNTAWQNYRSGLQNIPNFHSRKAHPYEWRYQTNCLYHKNKNGQYIGSARILNRHSIRLPKADTLHAAYIRPAVCQKHDYRIGTITVSKDSLNHFYVSLQLASDTPFRSLPKQYSHKQIRKMGYDLNSSNFLASTNRRFVDRPNYYKRQLHRLRNIQRIVSRKYNHNKGHKLANCRNYQKMRLKSAHVQKYVYNQRRNFLNNLSTKLVENQDILIGEELRSKNMLRNRAHNRSIRTTGWRIFINMLAQKCQMYNKILLLVNPAYTTQRCSYCGYICNKKDDTHLGESQRSWVCPKCHHKHIRDINAATNVLQRGLKKYHEYKRYLKTHKSARQPADNKRSRYASNDLVLYWGDGLI